MSKLIVPNSGIAVPQRGDMGAQMTTVYDAVCRDRLGNVRWHAKAKNLVVTAGLNKLLDATFKTGLASPLWYVGCVGPTITDAAITNGTANLTSASNDWTAADAGSPIIVRGAGASGNDLSTTILTYSSAGAVVLAANAGTAVTGARSTWGPRAADTMASHAPWVESTAVSNATRPAFTPGSIAAGAVSNSGSPAVFTVNADNTYLAGMFMSDNSTLGGATGTLYGMAVWSSGGFRQSYSGDTVSVTANLSATSTQ